MPWPDRRLTDRLKIEHPIIVAPMAGAMNHELAAEVAEAGGLGSLPCAMLDVCAGARRGREISRAHRASRSISDFSVTRRRN